MKTMLEIVQDLTSGYIIDCILAERDGKPKPPKSFELLLAEFKLLEDFENE